MKIILGIWIIWKGKAKRERYGAIGSSGEENLLIQIIYSDFYLNYALFSNSGEISIEKNLDISMEVKY